MSWLLTLALMMKKSKKDKKRMILRLVSVVAILIAISYIPVKKAVYADKDDERRFSKHGVLEWYEKRIDNISAIVETSGLADRLQLKVSGLNYIGKYDTREPPTYYDAQGLELQGYIIRGTSPLLKLNASFDPCKVKNYFAIKYESFYEAGLGEMKEDHYELPIIIYDWTPVYPIQRSGTLANLLLPKSYLTIWDFIG